VQDAAGRRRLDREPEEPRCVEPVHRGPAVRAVADVAGDAGAPGDLDQEGDETVVAVAVHGRREPHDRGAHAAAGERERRLLRRDAV
jgi:hypothetical protein